MELATISTLQAAWTMAMLKHLYPGKRRAHAGRYPHTDFYGVAKGFSAGILRTGKNCAAILLFHRDCAAQDKDTFGVAKNSLIGKKILNKYHLRIGP